ncbi:hypothetical protein GCM10023189_25750 [Nibrella saemangeumensis]|uniref:M23ase beta-sheet core domain-containing protein n=1 Tax=Nibrella saemangeumensis TaxID=1084526 RepID=A0ABP8MXG1_9BACT
MLSLRLAAQPRNRQALEKEKKQNLEKMSQIRNILKQTSSQKNVSLGQLKALNQQIKTQSSQIGLLSEDLKLIESEMADLRRTSQSLDKDLDKLKKEYAAMIYAADKRRQQVNPLGFLFSADNYNQLVARYRYLRQYSDARQSQVRQIQGVQRQLEDKRLATERKRRQQNSTLLVKLDESKKLETLKEEQNKVVDELGKKEALLRTELVESRRAVSRLETIIRRVIEREARERAERERLERERLARLEAARKAAEKKRAEEAAAAAAATNSGAASAGVDEKTTPAPPAPTPSAEAPAVAEATTRPAERTNANNLNEAEVALASSFTASKNRLPWPVQHGFVSDRFGRKEHPVLKGVIVENLGIDIQTNAGEPVRAVYEGIVRDVTYMPGMNTVVAIQHGDYMTVYAKLRSSIVKVGQRVKARDNIGFVSTDKDGVSEVQFQIWKNYSRLNPESWLVPR